MRLKSLLLGDAEARTRKELGKQLHREAEYFAAVIKARLTQLEICYRYPKSQKDFMSSAVQEVQFLRSVGTPEAIYLMVDSRRLPRGVKVGDLANEDVLEDLGVACRRSVRFRYETRCGAWFIVERAGGAWGVPKRLDFGEVLAEWPHSSRKKLLVPLGVGENRKLVYRSLADFPHALVGGATNTGKSTLMHGWICALVMKNDATDLRLALVDLKGGVEFVRYKGLPHIVGPDLFGVGDDDGDPDGEPDGEPGGWEATGFVKRPGDVVPLLAVLQKEMDRRLYRFERAGGIQNIDIWNYRRRGEKLARIVLFIDELASLMLDTGMKKDVSALLADITARGRAPGIHAVLCTQRPERAVVPGLVKGNVDARFAFRVPDNASSMVILDTTEAARFDDTTPQGRFIYRRGIDKEEIQAPFITPGQMTEIVRDVAEGRADDTEAAKIAPEDIFRLAVRQLEGNFSYRTLYDALGGRVGYDYLKRLGQEHEGEVVDVDGELYELRPAAGPNPRRLVPIGVGREENNPLTSHISQDMVTGGNGKGADHPLDGDPPVTTEGKGGDSDADSAQDGGHHQQLGQAEAQEAAQEAQETA